MSNACCTCKISIALCNHWRSIPRRSPVSCPLRSTRALFPSLTTSGGPDLRAPLACLSQHPSATKLRLPTPTHDVAAQRFRSHDVVTNFKPPLEFEDDAGLVLSFLVVHSKAEIDNMLQKHTNHIELQQSKRVASSTRDECLAITELHVRSCSTWWLHRVTSGSLIS
ncbi:AP2/ERF and B3 domain-containing transcription repressor RAV2-like [Canna indica]|uniref:AP2/ERF and B3 domain-containing transcription repressor RAV2-like n=1 Tax=Canna indica TaxID=4628 RepID=A0AAQ3QHZ9_9LILI|nr:AP2/ERF and B3 domain-containing transcription repressor RAV2-like [Canna indica]